MPHSSQMHRINQHTPRTEVPGRPIPGDEDYLGPEGNVVFSNTLVETIGVGDLEFIHDPFDASDIMQMTMCPCVVHAPYTTSIDVMNRRWDIDLIFTHGCLCCSCCCYWQVSQSTNPPSFSLSPGVLPYLTGPCGS